SFFILMIHLPSTSTLFPYTTLFRSYQFSSAIFLHPVHRSVSSWAKRSPHPAELSGMNRNFFCRLRAGSRPGGGKPPEAVLREERSEEHTSDSSHLVISYAVFCLKKK